MMNANELANLLEVDSWYKLVTREEIATMLRQQQAEIEALNQRIERMIEKQSHYESMAHAGGFEAGRELGMKQERERNNEPVAWMLADREKEHIRSIMAVQHDFVPQGCVEIPLYTHPVSQYKAITNTKIEPTVVSYTHPVKEQLTDEEINKIYLEKYDGHMGFLSPDEVREFARAILRKAQEK